MISPWITKLWFLSGRTGYLSINCFVWRLVKNMILTLPSLDFCGINVSSIACLFRHSAEETIDHLFFLWLCYGYLEVDGWLVGHFQCSTYFFYFNPSQPTTYENSSLSFKTYDTNWKKKQEYVSNKLANPLPTSFEVPRSN